MIGAFMLLNRHIIDRIGFFDERFFVYYEDMDFCKRVKEYKRVHYNASIQIYHKGMGTTENVKAYRLALSVESRLKYIKKHFALVSYFFVLFISLVIEPFFRLIYTILRLKFKETEEIVRGYCILTKRLLALNEIKKT
ncbi:MAG: hypothetical protein U5L45_12280 [Saprospiraceae bacterium]|nr:hypothetical protein [Saprospiraceae bacterium]